MLIHHSCRLVFAALLALAAPTSAQAQTTAPEPTESFIGVRVLKVAGAGDLDWSVQLPSACSGCRLAPDSRTTTENAKEFYFHILAPASLKAIEGLVVMVNATKVRRVLVGRREVPFRREGARIVLDAPRPQLEELVAEFHSFIETPGVRLRVEHADEARRHGRYTDGPWPARQWQAALNLEFAAREAIVELGLDLEMQHRGLGVIQLMGFDTNYPTLGPEAAHTDFPPHWHMFAYWSPGEIRRSINHVYINAEGLLTHNDVDVRTRDLPAQKGGHYEAGQPFETMTLDGNVLWSETVTAGGGFILAAGRRSCRFTPVAKGFESGVLLDCDGADARIQVHAEDELGAGTLRLFIDGQLVERYEYDRDNGIVLRSEIDRERGVRHTEQPSNRARLLPAATE